METMSKKVQERGVEVVSVYDAPRGALRWKKDDENGSTRERQEWRGDIREKGLS